MKAGGKNITRGVASNRSILVSPSAVLPFVIMDATRGSKRATGDEHGCRVDIEGGERAAVELYQRASMYYTATAKREC